MAATLGSDNGKALAAARIRESVRMYGKHIVVPVATGDGWAEEESAVGEAASLSEAVRLVHAGGYRIMWRGGFITTEA